ncbi:unnamed protein product [Sphacelaria rigidula]
MDDTVNVYTESQTGTLNYMAPEAFQDMGSGAIDPATGKKKAVMKLGRSSDVWSLGCILYQMAYGQAPFSHVRPMVLKYQAITSPEFVIEFPDLGDESLVETLRGCLTRDPPARPPIPGADGLLAHRYLQPVPSREALRRQKEALDRREAELTKREAFACDCQRRRGPRGIARGDERQASA